MWRILRFVPCSWAGEIVEQRLTYAAAKARVVVLEEQFQNAGELFFCELMLGPTAA
jgi:hypothetical protein